MERRIALTRRSALTLAGTVTLAVTATSACSDSTSTATPPASAVTSVAAAPARATAAVAPATSASAASATSITDRYVAAANAGDADQVAAIFAPDATVDITGRIFSGRDGIMSDFINPEVIGQGGQYRVINRTPRGGDLVVEYNFGTEGGLKEHFTYTYSVANGMITRLIGRYVT